MHCCPSWVVRKRCGIWNKMLKMTIYTIVILASFNRIKRSRFVRSHYAVETFKRHAKNKICAAHSRGEHSCVCNVTIPFQIRWHKHIMYLSEISTESCKKITASINTNSGFFTTRNRSCGKEMHVSVILYTGSSTIPPSGQPPLKTRYSTLRPDSLLWPDPPSTLGPDPLLPPRPEPPGGKNMGPDRMWHHTPWKIMGPDRKWTPPRTTKDTPWRAILWWPPQAGGTHPAGMLSLLYNFTVQNNLGL